MATCREFFWQPFYCIQDLEVCISYESANKWYIAMLKQMPSVQEKINKLPIERQR